MSRELLWVRQREISGLDSSAGDLPFKRIFSMERYGNRGGDSGVVGYEIGQGSIIVAFGDGWKYLYDGTKPGAADVAKLQQLARSGHGLNSYITRVVQGRWARNYR